MDALFCHFLKGCPNLRHSVSPKLLSYQFNLLFNDYNIAGRTQNINKINQSNFTFLIWCNVGYKIAHWNRILKHMVFLFIILVFIQTWRVFFIITVAIIRLSHTWTLREELFLAVSRKLFLWRQKTIRVWNVSLDTRDVCVMKVGKMLFS